MVWNRIAPYKTQFMIYSLGLFVLAAGISKLLNPGPWAAYTPSWFLSIVPVTAVQWMYVTATIETGTGLLILSRWKTHVWAAVAAAWLFGVTVAVASTGIYDVAFRDLGLVLFAVAVSLEAYTAR